MKKVISAAVAALAILAGTTASAQAFGGIVEIQPGVAQPCEGCSVEKVSVPGVTSVSSTSTTATISWIAANAPLNTPAEGLLGYWVFAFPEGGEAQAAAVSSDTTSHTFSGLPPSTAVRLEVCPSVIEPPWRWVTTEAGGEWALEGTGWTLEPGCFNKVQPTTAALTARHAASKNKPGKGH